MSSINKLLEMEIMLEAYEDSDLGVEEFAEEFFRATQLILKKGIPVRELDLCVKVPYQKSL